MRWDNEDKQLIDDVAQLLYRAINTRIKYEDGYRTASLEGEDLNYKTVDTLLYLEQNGIGTPVGIEPLNYKESKGSVPFWINYPKALDWIEKRKYKLIPKLGDRFWIKETKFTNNSMIVPQYGKCSFHLKNSPKIDAKINVRAFLVEFLINKGEKGATIYEIRETFTSNGIAEAMTELESIIVQINKRFAKEFKDISVVIENIGNKNKEAKRYAITFRNLKS